MWFETTIWHIPAAHRGTEHHRTPTAPATAFFGIITTAAYTQGMCTSLNNCDLRVRVEVSQTGRMSLQYGTHTYTPFNACYLPCREYTSGKIQVKPMYVAIHTHLMCCY